MSIKKIKKIFYSVEEFEDYYFPNARKKRLSEIKDPKEFGRKLAEKHIKGVSKILKRQIGKER